MMELRYGKVATEAKDYLPIRIIDKFLNKDSSDSLAETIGAIYKRGAGKPKPCRQRDRAN
ncbi:hypothetical protein [Porphyromonas sp.]